MAPNMSFRFFVFLFSLFILLILEFVSDGHAYFDTVDFWGFNAWFGFGVTVFLIVFARAISAFISREGSYYD